MKITPGKLAGMQAVSNDRGVIAAAAMDQRGSLKKAAQELEMSYRNAWGYLRDLEAAAGFKFVERVPGGGPESGMRLTKAGKRFLERYHKFRSGLDEAARRQFDRAFGA